MPRIGIISQARTGSSRLPAKVLLTAAGKTLLQWHFERLSVSGYPVILATTTNPNDDVLSEWAATHQHTSYRGSESNVLARYRDCAAANELDIIVRVTSDCPLIDGNLINEGVQWYLKFGEDRQYVTNGQSNFARGFDFEIFSYALLDEAYRQAQTPHEFEHVTPYFYKTRRLDIPVRHFPATANNSHLRVTVDTKEDYELICRLIEEHRAGVSSHTEITALLNQRPDLVAINQHIKQKRFG